MELLLEDQKSEQSVEDRGIFHAFCPYCPTVAGAVAACGYVKKENVHNTYHPGIDLTCVICENVEYWDRWIEKHIKEFHNGRV